jgi:hypothetical protein
MARRKRRRGDKRSANGRPAETAEPSPGPDAAQGLPPRPALRANPPRKNLPLLIVSIGLTIGWIAFLVAMAAGG